MLYFRKKIPSSKNKESPLKKVFIFSYILKIKRSRSNIKKFLIFSYKESLPYISGNENPEKIPYISGNGNPKKLLIFLEVIFRAWKMIFLYFRRWLVKPEKQTKRICPEEISYISLIKVLPTIQDYCWWSRKVIKSPQIPRLPLINCDIKKIVL